MPSKRYARSRRRPGKGPFRSFGHRGVDLAKEMLPVLVEELGQIGRPWRPWYSRSTITTTWRATRSTPPCDCCSIPEGVCFAIAARTEPPLPVARLRARGRLVEVDAGDLRFSLGETETFLSQVRLDAVARDEIQKAAELVRGCPAPGPRIVRLIARAGGQPRPAKRLTLSNAGVEELSVRELGVLRLLASELTRRGIAARLYPSLNTVKSHARSIFRKLGVSGREQPVARELELI
jgi:ATP/maltotriose-dependent transcriptional regulator MalT